VVQRFAMTPDLAYLVFARRKELELVESQRSATSRVMTVSTRAKFERVRKECSGHILKANEYAAALWRELSMPTPHLHVVEVIGAAMQRSISHAETAFEKLLTLNPSSSVTYNRYAEFLFEVRRALVAMVCLAVPRCAIWSLMSLANVFARLCLTYRRVCVCVCVCVSRFTAHTHTVQTVNDSSKAMRMQQLAMDVDDTIAREQADISADVHMFSATNALDASREDVSGDVAVRCGAYVTSRSAVVTYVVLRFALGSSGGSHHNRDDRH
jgi:hypothetical protein